MGNSCAGQSSSEPPECAYTCVHSMHFPMFVVKVSDFLQMTGVPEAHGALQAKGLLHEWQPGMFTAFVSHQWLGNKHPDPRGNHRCFLRETLKEVLAGNLAIESDIVTQNRGGVNEETTRSEAARAVQSIPAYVEACDLFIALVRILFAARADLHSRRGDMMLTPLTGCATMACTRTVQMLLETCAAIEAMPLVQLEAPTVARANERHEWEYGQRQHQAALRNIQNQAEIFVFLFVFAAESTQGSAAAHHFVVQAEILLLFASKAQTTKGQKSAEKFDGRRLSEGRKTAERCF
eukprot:Skav225070  [mRNA]  locus=scaffold4576:22118:42484:- [translate_table: standard]